MTADSTATALVHQLFERVVSAGELGLVQDLYTPDFVDRSPGPGQAAGPRGIAEVVARYREAIPDLQVTVEEVLAIGDRVVTRERWRGTHTGVLGDLPPTHLGFVAMRMHIFRLVDGRIAEEWTAGSVHDLLATSAPRSSRRWWRDRWSAAVARSGQRAARR